MNRIDGKVAVITGGTQGLGAAIARLRAEAGAAGLVIVGRGLEKGKAVAAEITARTGVPVEMVAADLGDIDEVRAIIAGCARGALVLAVATPFRCTMTRSNLCFHPRTRRAAASRRSCFSHARR